MTRPLTRLATVLAALSVGATLLCAPAGRGQEGPTVPPPQRVLGYELGDRFSSHGLIEKYLFALRDSASDRVRLVPYGETYEGRTLYLVIISSPENLGRLDLIKSNIHKL